MLKPPPVPAVFSQLAEQAATDASSREAAFKELAQQVFENRLPASEVSAGLTACGRSLDDLRNVVARLTEIARLKSLVDQYPQRAATAYRTTLASNRYGAESRILRREIESKIAFYRSMQMQTGLAAAECQEAARQVAAMTGEPYQLGNPASRFREIDAEFAVTVAAVEVVVNEPTTPVEPVLIEAEPTAPTALPTRRRQNAEPVGV